MGSSRTPGSLLEIFGFTTFLPARSPGFLGYNDQGDPDRTTLLGDTPGPLGIGDLADPSLPILACYAGNGLGRSSDGKPVASAAGASTQRDFRWPGKFDRDLLQRGFFSYFSGTAHYDAGAVGGLLRLVECMEEDSGIQDLRWMAYMLATTYWETSILKRRTVKGKDAKGRPTERSQKYWTNMSPVEEAGHGSGRAYHLPVKVLRMKSGEVQVTEQDGDQFLVSSNGKYKQLSAKASRGSVDGAAASVTYTDAEGDPLAYYGRGYVQLTWWNNYARTGAAIGMGLELLLNPEKALDPAIAYTIMSNGMRTGDGFANGYTFDDFFAGEKCDYVGARKMVNGSDHAADIADLAERFEDLLFEARRP